MSRFVSSQGFKDGNSTVTNPKSVFDFRILSSSISVSIKAVNGEISAPLFFTYFFRNGPIASLWSYMPSMVSVRLIPSSIISSMVMVLHSS